jgi:purine-binding chemotaxis protein CheW
MQTQDAHINYESKDREDRGPCLQYLTYTLDDEVFAMDVRSVREVIQYASMTTVPLMPVFVRGVINLRGQVVPVIDLQSRLGRSVAHVRKKTCIIIFDGLSGDEKVAIGLMVDAVNEVIDIPDADVEPPPQFGASIRKEFIRGMGKVGAEFVVILESEKALSIEDMAILAEQSCLKR